MAQKAHDRVFVDRRPPIRFTMGLRRRDRQRREVRRHQQWPSRTGRPLHELLGTKRPTTGACGEHASTGVFKARGFPTPLPDDAYSDNWIAANGLRLIAGAPRHRPLAGRIFGHPAGERPALRNSRGHKLGSRRDTGRSGLLGQGDFHVIKERDFLMTIGTPDH
jgi:hypothetical protein